MWMTYWRESIALCKSRDFGDPPRLTIGSALIGAPGVPPRIMVGRVMDASPLVPTSRGSDSDD
jgi:hypothetical protein